MCMSCLTEVVADQLFVAPKSNNWRVFALLQFFKDNAEEPICTHLLLAADWMVQPVVNVPLVPGSPQ